MTVATKAKNNKRLDLKAILAANPPVEPKTLDEIYYEVGYPFTARTVCYVDGPDSLPVGEDYTFTARYGDDAHTYTGVNWAARGDIKRWQLLGHIPGGTK